MLSQIYRAWPQYRVLPCHPWDPRCQIESRDVETKESRGTLWFPHQGSPSIYFLNGFKYFPSSVSYRFYCRLSSSLIDPKKSRSQTFFDVILLRGGWGGMTPENWHLIQHWGSGSSFISPLLWMTLRWLCPRMTKSKINILLQPSSACCNPSQCRMLISAAPRLKKVKRHQIFV